jgi:hypothetical protein
LQAFPFLGISISPWKDFPYAMGNMSIMSPSLGGGFIQSSRLAIGPRTSGGGGRGFSSNISVSSTPFFLYDYFGNDPFSSTTMSAGETPSSVSGIPCHVFFPHKGCHQVLIIFSVLGEDEWRLSFYWLWKHWFLSKSRLVCELFLKI